MDKINEKILKQQILETLNVPAFKSYWYDTEVTNYMYSTIINKFGYDKRQGFFSTMIWDDNEFLKPLGSPYKTNTQFCWRIKPDQQKDMLFLEEVYSEWKRGVQVELGLIPDKSKEIFSLESRLSSGAYIKYSDFRIFNNAIIELQTYKNYSIDSTLTKLDKELSDLLGDYKNNTNWVKVKDKLIKDKYIEYIIWVASSYEWMIRLNHFNLVKDYHRIVRRIELTKEFNIDISKHSFASVLSMVPAEAWSK